MKLIELNEQFGVSSIIEKLKTDCKQYLSDIDQDSGLFRGMKQDRGNFVKLNVRKDRLPSDMPKIIHNIIDKWFLEKFGHRYRSNALFAYANNIRAPKGYGTVYEIFPIGEYQCVYSPDVLDLYGRLASKLDYYEKVDQKQFEELKEKIENELEHFNYQKLNVQNINEYMANEIMIKCDSYYALKESHDDKTLSEEIEKLKREI